MPEDLPSPEPMKSPSLSRRIYNSSFTLAISFGFYGFIFLFTLSCEGEKTATLPLQNPQEKITRLGIPTDSIATLPSEVVSFVEKIDE